MDIKPISSRLHVCVRVSLFLNCVCYNFRCTHTTVGIYLQLTPSIIVAHLVKQVLWNSFNPEILGLFPSEVKTILHILRLLCMWHFLAKGNWQNEVHRFTCVYSFEELPIMAVTNCKFWARVAWSLVFHISSKVVTLQVNSFNSKQIHP